MLELGGNSISILGKTMSWSSHTSTLAQSSLVATILAHAVVVIRDNKRRQMYEVERATQLAIDVIAPSMMLFNKTNVFEVRALCRRDTR